MLRLGKSRYQWLQAQFYRPKRRLLSIYWLDDPNYILEVEFLETEEDLSAVQAMEWLELALKKGWGHEQQVLKFQVKGRQPQLLPQLISDEAELAQQIVDYSKRPKSTAFGLQQNWQIIQDLEEDMGMELPSCMRQLYLYNGVEGGWGPDSGFFPPFPTSAYSYNLRNTYKEMRKGHVAADFWGNHPHLLAFLHWGTDVFSCLDVVYKTVWAFDPNLKTKENSWEDCSWLQSSSLYEWLHLWISTDLFGVSLWRDMYEKKGLISKK